jgi:hypothetical protein
MYDAHLSQDIFRQLMSGKVINKTRLNNNGAFVANELYEEIRENIEDYRTQYRMSGLELVEEESFYSLNDRSRRLDLKTDLTLKACLLLDIIFRHLANTNYRISKLTDGTAGISDLELEAIQESEELMQVFRKLDFSNKPFLSVVKSTLVNRGLMLEKPGGNAYVLSDAGQAYYSQILEANSRR